MGNKTTSVCTKWQVALSYYRKQSRTFHCAKYGVCEYDALFKTEIPRLAQCRNAGLPAPTT